MEAVKPPVAAGRGVTGRETSPNARGLNNEDPFPRSLLLSFDIHLITFTASLLSTRPLCDRLVISEEVLPICLRDKGGVGGWHGGQRMDTMAS